MVFAIVAYRPANYIVILTSILIILISSKEIFSSKNAIYGTSQIFYIFCLFFLGVAPMFQYLENITLWGGRPFTDADYIKTNLLILLALCFYKFIYAKTFQNKYKLKIYFPIDTKAKRRQKRVSTLLLVSISLLTSAYIFYIFGANIFTLLLRSEYAESEVASSGGLSYLLNSFFIRPIPAICFLLYKFYQKKNAAVEILLLFLMLITNSPTGMPRFAVAAFYIPFVFVYFKFVRKQYNFPFIMIFAIVVIFPLLNLFRLIGEGDVSFAVNINMFLQGHFDSYQMFMRVISENYITYGYQLLGVLFFFVPRSLWASKPIGSGYFVAHEQGYYFDNLSMNFLGEGYINFGVFGVVIFSILIAYVNARLDRKYWIEGGMSLPSYSLIFFETIGMEFAIMRGALMNIFPVLIGYIIATLIVNNIATTSFERLHLRGNKL